MKTGKTSSVLAAALAMALLFLLPAAQADSDFEMNNYTGSFFEITKYTGNETNLIIQAIQWQTPVIRHWDYEWHTWDIDGGEVQCRDAIADSAFENSNVTEVVLKNTYDWVPLYNCSWRRIGNDAFRNCKQLRKVTIPKSVHNIGTGVFDGCDLKLLTVCVDPGSTAERYCKDNGIYFEYAPVTAGQYTYRPNGDGTADLLRFTLNRAAFAAGMKPSLTVSLPDSLDGYRLTRICEGAFRDMTMYQTLEIPATVTVIENEAFMNWASLQNVTIPSSVTAIGENAFAGCDSLAEVNYTGSKSQWNRITVGTGNNALMFAAFSFR